MITYIICGAYVIMALAFFMVLRENDSAHDTTTKWVNRVCGLFVASVWPVLVLFRLTAAAARRLMKV